MSNLQDPQATHNRKLGIVCPKCWQKMEHHYTRQYVGYTQRSRKCRRCGVQVITREEIRVVVRT